MAKVFTIAEGLENMGALKTGGQGSVYKGRRVGEIITAVKLLPTPIYSESEDDKNFLSFQNEVQKLKKVNEVPNPNVVKILNSGISESGSFPFIEMEFIEGPDLEELLKPPHEPIFTLKEVIKVAEQLSCALAHCHKVDVKHGDIKSNNVKFNIHTGNYVLLDFGLAVMSDEQRRTSLRHAGAIEFMAPEQNEGAMLFQTDVYSFGIILYELLAGVVPFPLSDKGETSRNKVMVSHMETPPPDLIPLRRQHLPQSWSQEKKDHEMNVPQWLTSLIYKCLQKKPEARFTNGVALHEYILLNGMLASAKTEHTDDYMKVLQQENQKLLQEKDQLQRQLLQYQQSHGNRDNELASLRASLSERERELQSVRLQTNSYNTPVVRREGVSKSAFYALLILTLGLGALAAYGLLYNKKPTQQVAAQTPTDTVAKNEPPVPKRQIIGQYKVAADKAYFHNEPDEATRRNAYLVPTEEVTIDAWDERNNFIYTEFTNSRGQRSKGWLRKQDLITLEDWRRNGGGKVSAEEASRQLANAKELLNSNNVEGALAIYRPLSQQGVPEAMYQYGDLALKNKNTEIDCPTAMTLLKNASDKNFTPAKRTLGFLYLFAENKSVLQLNNYDRCTYDKDIYKGSKLLMEAVIQGDSTAKRILEELNLSKQNGENPEGQGQ